MFQMQRVSGLCIKKAGYVKFYNFQKLFSSKVTENTRTKICIVGSGPAGFYTAQHILKNQNIEVDIYEKLPIPFGLIRYGVAPDHPEIKNVINTFTKVASNDRVNFFGNVCVGQDVSVPELLSTYHAVVLAYGANQDRHLNIPGENLCNVLSAREFVGWYNGSPEHTNLNVDLNVESAAIIGQGNVALDVARILLKNTEELKTTDITEYSYEALKNSKIRRVYLIGRRGPLQVAFTIKEFREITKLKGLQIATTFEDFHGVKETIPSIERPRKRLTELMLKIASEFTLESSKNVSKSMEFKFFRSPKAILGDGKGRVQNLQLCINDVEGPYNSVKVMHTEKEEIIDCGLVMRSVGYKSSLIDPFVPFKENKSIIPNEYGRVLDKEGLYCSGWVKTGPIGVILSTMYGSFETGDVILKDLENGHLPNDFRKGSKEILFRLQSRGVAVMTFDQWKIVDAIEKERGKAQGKSREKILDPREMLKLSCSC